MIQTMLDVLDKKTYDVSSLRLVHYASAPMPVPLLRRAKKRVRRHADDYDGSDCEHLERRNQDRGGAKHGRYRLHRKGVRENDHLA